MTKTIKELEGKTWPPRSLWMPLPHLRKHKEEQTHGVGREEVLPHRGGPGSTRCANNRIGGGGDSKTEAVKAGGSL